jgi:hypothetical protein
MEFNEGLRVHHMAVSREKAGLVSIRLEPLGLSHYSLHIVAASDTVH